MVELPVVRQPRELARVEKVQRRAEVAVFEHGVQARVLAEIDRIDSQALGDALRASLDEEVALLDYGLHLANGDKVAVELVARKVGLQSAVNNQRIMRRFGR